MPVTLLPGGKVHRTSSVVPEEVPPVEEPQPEEQPIEPKPKSKKT